MICAVDVETSGLNPGYHQIMSLAIIPVDDNWGAKLDDALNLRLRVSIFDKKALAINKLNPQEGLTRQEGYDAFNAWRARLGIQKIIALGHNIIFDLSFMSHWLPKNDNVLHYLHYDTMQLALIINSKYKVFDGVSLAKVSKTLGCENPTAHDALSDALTSLNCYKTMLDRFILKGHTS